MASTFNKVDESFAKIVGEQQLKNYVKFTSQYAQQLSEIENAIGSENNILWNARLNPISLKASPEEKVSLPNLISSENKVLNKVITVLSSLCLEIQTLETEAVEEFYDPFLFYGETGEVDKQVNDGDFQLEMGRLFPHLQKLWCFGQRCRETVHNIVQQLAALYNKTMPKVMDTSQVHFTSVYEHLCTLFRVLITIDEILDSNSALRNHWNHYKSMVKSIRHNPSDFGVTDEKVRRLEKMMNKIEKLVINANLLENCFDQDFDDSGIPVIKNLYFAEEFITNIKLIVTNIDNGIGSSGETDHRFQFVGLCGLFVFHYKLFHSLDKKLFKQIWDMYKKLPCVCLSGHVTWFPDTFLAAKMPPRSKAVDGKMSDLASQCRLAWLSAKAQSIPRECQTMYSTVNSWLVKLVSGSVENKSLDGLSKKMKFFIEGYILVNSLRTTVDTVMNLHANTSKPMTKNEVLSLCRIMTMSKAVASAFNQHSLQVVQSSLHVVQYLQNQITFVLELAKKRVASDKRYSERRVDILCALMLCERCVNGAPTLQRLTTAKIALSVANQSRVLKDEEYLNFLTNVDKLALFGNKGILQSVNIAADHSAFYWQRSLLVNYFDGLCQDPTDASRLQFMFAALQDCVVHLKKVKHLESSDALVNEYRDEVMQYLKQNLLDVICKEIENDLRLSVHTHLKLDDRNPFRVGIKSLRQLLSLQQIRFLNHFIDVKAYVTHYLDQTFYNLTTVALHDWKTYSEMRNLAYQKYQLNMQEVHLPNQQLEQGLDVLEIMRNIHVFVSKYLYNLNNQIFVESSSNNKHLNTINIRHIANSIRTHGTGIMNTTVNFTFQFLKKKFYIFSQFLFDEHIKSRLIKDIRSFRENREAWNQMYPYDKADKFNRGIRKLGLSPDGSSYLDQFRLLISHIGNAMGYIRMVRSGGLHCCSDAIRFVPDLEEMVNFEEIAQAEQISEEVNVSFSQFDSVTSSLVKNSAEGSDYLRMLIEVFAPEFRSSKNLHLKNFYTMVPPLTLNYVEHSITCKERMSKKNKLGAAFTDDGFAMGLAYILKLLDQYSEFDSLHWFQSVRRKHAEDVKLQSSSNDPKKKGNDEEEKLMQTKALALKRISIYQREFELLYYSLSSARIFFRADLSEKNREEGEKSSSSEKTENSPADQNASNPTPAN